MPLQTLSKKTPLNFGWLLLFLFLLGAYSPLVLKGGIIADDWGDIAQNLICNGFYDCYRSWFPLFSNRPIAPLPITASTLIFGLHTTGYLIVNSALYLIALLVTANVIKQSTTLFSNAIFIALGSIPTIAMPVLVSPINQSTATLAFLLWSLSLSSLNSFLKNNSQGRYLLSYLLLLFSLLTYEVMLPLLILTMFLPFMLHYELFKNRYGTYFLKYIFPVIIVMALVLIWQKMIAPLIFGTVYSRLSFDPNNIGFFFLSWLSVFTTQIPELFINTAKRINTSLYLVGIILCAYLISTWMRQVRNGIHSSESINSKYRFLFVSGLCFLASSSIFILAGAGAEIGGYQARALSSTWLCLALLIASLMNLASRKIYNLILVLAFSCFVYFSFAVQRDNYIRSWQLQTRILEDVLGKIEIANITPDATVIGNVPGYLPNNFNNEIVFTQPWDFGAALSLYTNKKIAGGAVLDTRASNFSKPIKLSGGILSIDRWWKTDTANLWFYDYDPNTRSGTLKRIPDVDSLKKLLVSLGYLGEFESKSYVTTNSPILFANDWLDRSKYIISGWGERENWGGIWSTQDRATIKLPMPEDGAGSISFNANAFVSPIHPRQEVLVYINGHLQGKASLDQFEGNIFSIPLPQIENKTVPITIDFEFPNATSPKSLKIGDDDRKLGIGLKAATYH